MRLRLSSTAVTIWPRPQRLFKAPPFAQRRLIYSSQPRYTWRDDFKSTPERDARAAEDAKKVKTVHGKPPPPGQPHYYVSIWPFERAPSAERDSIYYAEDAEDAEDAKMKRRVGRFMGFIFFFAVPLYLIYLVPLPEKQDKVFDAPRFTPFAIVSREDVSPTSMILTIRPKTKLDSDPYTEYWQKGLWSVEFKQPLLQIARSYTPLPPTENTANGDLRFLIRKEPTGEMSNYLFGLSVDGKVEVRGPHSEFDMPENVQNVVFLAGGTGIAPALQVVHTLLEARKKEAAKPRIHIIWANRRREECIGAGAYVPDRYSTGRTTEDLGVMVRQLQELQDKYPENLRVDYVVDEERTFIDQKMISRAIKPSPESQDDNDLAQSNSKLLFVSGPEGFINYFAGPKKWWNGKETQGKLGGILGRMGISDWSVFKL
ncbi:Riboflavin synthase-like beta-barrel protein [Rutstroemia sp. NJR-2017a BVV2]|nr:Riboflavin synthase-like beta-barrel protein [Rutstroemia sp. NJR-2017a BVV2]